MQLKNRETTAGAAWEIVEKSPYGVLSMVDDRGMPYAVALNLWRDGDCLYFHTAHAGHKTDCLHAHPQVSVCFVAHQEVAVEALTTHYASAVVTGAAREVTDPGEKLEQLKKLCRRYGVPEDHPAMKKDFSSCMPATAIWRIQVTAITGKVYR